MQNYCNIVKNKFNTLIQNMERNVSAFVADPTVLLKICQLKTYITMFFSKRILYITLRSL
ncbi:hypothetical protein SAMN04487832_1244 [Ruminococcus sp. XPD3002]|nr:hypothetical protein SAMN04487832_1244 [Ruminococcus flavefaciens]